MSAVFAKLPVCNTKVVVLCHRRLMHCHYVLVCVCVCVHVCVCVNVCVGVGVRFLLGLNNTIITIFVGNNNNVFLALKQLLMLVRYECMWLSLFY